MVICRPGEDKKWVGKSFNTDKSFPIPLRVFCDIDRFKQQSFHTKLPEKDTSHAEAIWRE